MIGEIYIASNFDYAIDIYQLRYKLWEDAHATVQKHMGWGVPSRVPSIDINHGYAKWISRVLVPGTMIYQNQCFHARNSNAAQGLGIQRISFEINGV